MAAPKGNQYAKGSKLSGRPTTYKPDYVEKVYEYLDTCGDTFDPDTKERQVKLPTLCGFAKFIGSVEKTVWEWSKRQGKNEDENENLDEFRNALSIIKNSQKVCLIEGSLAGRLNPNISKMLLNANHGLRETAVVENKSKLESMSDSEIDEKIAALKRAQDER